jgi:hypothetical protein
MNAPLRVAAGQSRPPGRLLLGRKRGTRAFMQPGGKIARHEDARSALAREVLGFLASSPRPRPMQGANACWPISTLSNSRETWCPPRKSKRRPGWIGSAWRYRLAPLTRDCVLPLLLSA